MGYKMTENKEQNIHFRTIKKIVYDKVKQNLKRKYLPDARIGLPAKSAFFFTIASSTASMLFKTIQVCGPIYWFKMF
jgi:hypothetical protein